LSSGNPDSTGFCRPPASRGCKKTVCRSGQRSAAAGNPLLFLLEPPIITSAGRPHRGGLTRSAPPPAPPGLRLCPPCIIIGTRPRAPHTGEPAILIWKEHLPCEGQKSGFWGG